MRSAHSPNPRKGVIDYDGAAEFVIKDVDRAKAAGSDPYYANVIEPDEPNFLDMESKEQIFLGTSGLNRPVVDVDGTVSVDMSKGLEAWKAMDERMGLGDTAPKA
jgi:EthD domain